MEAFFHEKVTERCIKYQTDGFVEEMEGVVYDSIFYSSCSEEEVEHDKAYLYGSWVFVIRYGFKCAACISAMAWMLDNIWNLDILNTRKSVKSSDCITRLVKKRVSNVVGYNFLGFSHSFVFISESSSA